MKSQMRKNEKPIIMAHRVGFLWVRPCVTGVPTFATLVRCRQAINAVSVKPFDGSGRDRVPSLDPVVVCVLN
jgi:hypothetical protein